MANNINAELKDRVVVVKGHKKGFMCRDGFGCSPHTNGSSIYGYYLPATLNSEGKEIWECISGYTVERIFGE